MIVDCLKMSPYVTSEVSPLELWSMVKSEFLKFFPVSSDLIWIYLEFHNDFFSLKPKFQFQIYFLIFHNFIIVIVVKTAVLQ